METITITDTGKLKTSQILAKCKKLFPVWSYYSDGQLDKDFPPVKTKRTFLYRQEADEELKDLSANDLKEKYPDKEFITLRERLLYEIEYFKRENKHLDIDYWTLCAGSRHSGGHVPDVRWYGGGLEVSWCDPGSANGFRRARGCIDKSSSLKSFNLDDIKIIIGKREFKLTKI